MQEIKTKCKNCIFATEKGSGCHFNRLEAFSKNGGTITVEDGSFVISNRFCNLKREEFWKKIVGQDKSTNELGLLARKESLLKAEVMLFIPENFDDLQLQDTLDNLTKSQVLKPAHVTLFYHSPKIKRSRLISLLKDYEVSWRIETFLEEKPVDKYVDSLVLKCESDYYLMLVCGDKLSEDFLANVDTAINEKMIRLLVVDLKIEVGGFDMMISGACQPFYENRFLINRFLHSQYYGNEAIDYKGEKIEGLMNKLNKIFADEKREYLIREYGELCKTLVL